MILSLIFTCDIFLLRIFKSRPYEFEIIVKTCGTMDISKSICPRRYSLEVKHPRYLSSSSSITFFIGIAEGV